MIYTDKIKNAIKFATKTHEVYQKQKRKGKDIPYIVHPLVVGLILARAGASEEVVAAGILHDTIEDSVVEKKVTREMLAERFGEQVAALVNSVTEQDKSLSWAARKEVAHEHISSFSHDSVLVKSADVISNTSEILDDYKKDGEAIFSRFNAPREQIVGHYLKAASALLERWPESPLAADLAEVKEQLSRVEAPGSEPNAHIEETMDLYLDEEQQKKRKIAFVNCEDEEGCKFFVEFKYPNCTFFFCKEHKMGFNIDLGTVSEAGVECKQHGKMERYNILTEDNVCPSCEKNTLAILSVGR